MARMRRQSRGFPAGFALVFTLFLIGILSFIPDQSLGASGGSAEAVRLRVASYNLWGLPGPLLQKPKRLKLIERELPAVGAEVVILNEAFHSKTRNIALLKEYPYRAYGPGKSGAKISSGVVVLSKYPILKAGKVKYSQCAGTDCMANKGAAYAQVDLPQIGPVQVIGTHLNAEGKDRLRTHQLGEALDLFEGDERAGPMIFAGDLNFHSESHPYADLVVEAGFRDVHAEYRAFQGGLATVPWFGFTYDPNRNKNLTWLKPISRPERLDYVWIKDSDCVQVNVQNSRLLFDRAVDGVHLSDHFGVLTDLELVRSPAGTCQREKVD